MIWYTWRVLRRRLAGLAVWTAAIVAVSGWAEHLYDSAWHLNAISSRFAQCQAYLSGGLANGCAYPAPKTNVRNDVAHYFSLMDNGRHMLILATALLIGMSIAFSFAIAYEAFGSRQPAKSLDMLVSTQGESRNRLLALRMGLGLVLLVVAEWVSTGFILNAWTAQSDVRHSCSSVSESIRRMVGDHSAQKLGIFAGAFALSILALGIFSILAYLSRESISPMTLTVLMMLALYSAFNAAYSNGNPIAPSPVSVGLTGTPSCRVWLPGWQFTSGPLEITYGIGLVALLITFALNRSLELRS